MTQQEILKIEIDGHPYHVYLTEASEIRYEGIVYPMVNSRHIDDPKDVWTPVFYDRDSSEIHQTLNDKCRYLFQFSFTTRGVWDERIYFAEGEEYNGDDLETMNLLWKKISAELKKRFEIKFPERDYSNY